MNSAKALVDVRVESRCIVTTASSHVVAVELSNDLKRDWSSGSCLRLELRHLVV